ncbi:Hydrolase (HAD superfamily) [Clostridiaceae bacterium JG1575]|nr:Hydrolase (HAD superfamily) [Clostridiaceae bacterium JG1575]
MNGIFTASALPLLSLGVQNGVSIGLAVLAVAAIVAASIVSRNKIRQAEDLVKQADQTIQSNLVSAKEKAESLKKEALLEAKDENHRLRVELDREIKDRRSEIARLEKRTIQKEESLDRKIDQMERKEESLNGKLNDIAAKEKDAQDLFAQRKSELERVSGYTCDEAKKVLMDEISSDAKHEAAILVKEIETRAREEGDKRAREIVTQAIQRCASDHVSETTVHVVSLPNDEMKGRIIGREGRNIRTLETLTGVDLIIDDTPEAVILSSFDPIRREIAKNALEKLIVDGRIHPARIEEMVEKSKKDVENGIKEEGEQAAFETGIHNLHPELQKLVGRLKFRTSYGQNVLKHSIEVSNLCGLMATELGLDPTIAKRAGLLHDIGKAVDHEVEGSHALIGADLAKKYHESSVVVNAIGAHHGDFEMESLEAVLVQAADAISAARPGARRETLETYIRRLEKLEEIANSYQGVEKSFAIQAGREIRIVVKPEIVDDLGAAQMAKDIVKRVEEELEYPGQIKVNVIRETRAVDYAK